MKILITVVALLGLLLPVCACTARPSEVPTPVATESSPSQPLEPLDGSPTTQTDEAPCRSVVVAAGDIVSEVKVADKTGRVAAAQEPAHVAVLGDNQYPSGSLADYRRKYHKTAWGDLKPITKPVPGNHEYRTKGAAGYFRYFDRPPPYYAYDAGCGWRGYALNSEIKLGKQLKWLRRDLADHPSAPVLASWHRPYRSSGSEHGGSAAMQPFWKAFEGRKGVVLNGHEHNYERFAPVGDLRTFVVGTGGARSYGFGKPVPGSQRRITGSPGVLRLDLESRSSYRWAFLNTAGTALDTGRDGTPAVGPG